MLVLSQDRVFLGFDVRLRLSNYWFIAQSELRAELVEKQEACSEKKTLVILATVVPKPFSATMKVQSVNDSQSHEARNSVRF